jgi:hypothetical protein
VALDARQPHFGSPIPVALRARLAAGPLRLERVAGEGVLDLGEGRPSYRGTLGAGRGALGDLPIDGLRSDVEARPPALTVEHASVELLGGTVTGAARLGGESDAVGFTAHGEVRGVDLARLPADEHRPGVAGILAADAEISGPAPTHPVFRLAARGKGRFEVTDGRIAALPLGRAMRDVLAPLLLGPQKTARLQERFPDLFGGDDLRFTRCAGSVELGNGRLRSDDLVAEGTSYEARGEGRVDHEGDVDLAVRVLASAALTDLLVGDSPARPVLVGTAGRLTVPLRVRGRLPRPAVTPDPAFAAGLARAILGGSGLGEAAGSLVERLLAPRRRRAR